jgi:IclR family transcriptional regulator, pca regulon regulatory protein
MTAAELKGTINVPSPTSEKKLMQSSRVAPRSAGSYVGPPDGSPESLRSTLFRAGDPDFMTSLARGLHVIRAFAGFGCRLTIADVSRATGLTRAVVRRCLYTLRELGYAGTDGRLYFLQPRVLDLGFAYLHSAPVPVAAQPILDEVSKTLGEASSVGVLDSGTVLFVGRAATNHIVSISLGVGSRLPAYCTALGRILLATLAPEQLDSQLANVEFVQHTRHTVTSRQRLDEILACVRNDGFAVNDQELEIGLRSIAVPIRNVAGTTIAAMNVSTQASRMTRRELLDRCLPVLRAAAERLSTQLPQTAEMQAR